MVNITNSMLKAFVSSETEIENKIPIIKRVVNMIVQKKFDHAPYIESHLEELLTYVKYGMGDWEFQSLRGYYSQINPVKAEEYLKKYNQLTLEN